LLTKCCTIFFFQNGWLEKQKIYFHVLMLNQMKLNMRIGYEFVLCYFFEIIYVIFGDNLCYFLEIIYVIFGDNLCNFLEIIYVIFLEIIYVIFGW
jgi:hypothetical protein